MTESGQQCTRTVEEAEKYCWQHKELHEVAADSPPESGGHSALKAAGTFAGGVAASLTASAIYDALKGGTPSAPSEAGTRPTPAVPTEADLMRELARYGVRVNERPGEGPPYTFQMPDPSAHSDPGAVYSSNIVGYTYDLAQLLRVIIRVIKK